MYRRLFLRWGFLALPVIYLAVMLPVHSGYKEGYGAYFLTASLIAVATVCLTSRTLTGHLVRGCVSLFAIAMLTELFWNYMDHPWFAGPETQTCDGPCFGWFSFENDSPTIIILLTGVPVTAASGILISAVRTLATGMRQRLRRSSTSRASA